MTAKPHTVEYFNEEYVEFRKIMGITTNWMVDNEDGSKPVERAFKGLTTVWMNTKGSKSDRDSVNSTFKAFMLEYNMRTTMMLTHPSVPCPVNCPH